MYYIYHIIGKKIGCSKNPERRIKQQSHGEFEILEQHEDINVASERELQLQKEYGYKVDYNTYAKSIQGYSHEKVSKAGVASATKQWSENRLRELEKCKKGGKIVKEKYSKEILQYDLNENFIKEWKGIKEAARTLNIKPPNLSATLNGRQKTCGGFIWKYK